MSNLINVVGGAATVCSMSSFVPQILKILRDRSADEVSLDMYLVTVTGFVLWTGYGLMSHSWPVVVSNIVCLLLAATILVLKWRFSRGR